MSPERRARAAGGTSRPADRTAAKLRIIGGAMRGRTLQYSGDPRTRPMKERVREAAFNLIGPAVKGKLAVDLFAGTGALGFEAISRGAVGAVFIERHFPTARLIESTAQDLGVADRVEVIPGNTFLAFRKPPPALVPGAGGPPWLVLCSPPFDYFVERRDDMLALLQAVCNSAPRGSMLVVEADERFDFDLLASLAEWDVREYPPAVLGVAAVTAPA